MAASKRRSESDMTSKKSSSRGAEERGAAAAEEGGGGDGEKLSSAQRARIERNRQRALLLRQARLANSPYSRTEKAVVHVAGTKLVDSGGGFFLEEENDADAKKVAASSPVQFEDWSTAIPFDENGLKCRHCSEPFGNSYLRMQFDEEVCDACRLADDKFNLITKTEAKELFLLKDCDLEKREPILRFVMKKNPHATYGQMHLYLRCQVEARALEVWETAEKLEEAKTIRSEKKDKLRKKRFNQKVQELRKSVRSSLWQKKSAVHEHDFGPEQFNEEEDNYYKNCQLCGLTVSYEKM